MNDGVASGKSGLESFWCGEVADNSLALDPFEIGEVRGFAGKEAKIGAFGGQGLGNVVADEAGSAGKKYFHNEAVAPARLEVFVEFALGPPPF